MVDENRIYSLSAVQWNWKTIAPVSGRQVFFLSLRNAFTHRRSMITNTNSCDSRIYYIRKKIRVFFTDVTYFTRVLLKMLKYCKGMSEWKWDSSEICETFMVVLAHTSCYFTLAVVLHNKIMNMKNEMLYYFL